jgi:hypothetical protein
VKGSIDNLATSSKKKKIRDLYRGIYGFKTGYQHGNNLLREETGDLLADSYNISNMVKNYLAQLLNVHNIGEVWQIEIHTAETLVPGPSRLEVEIAIAKLKEYKSAVSVKIPAYLSQAGSKTSTSVIHELINSIGIRKKCPISGRSLLLYQLTRWVIKLTVIIIVGYHKP